MLFDIKPQFHNMLNEHPSHNFNHHVNYRYMNNGGGSGSGRVGPAGSVQFRLEATDQDSEVCSPPLWGTISPPDSSYGEISPAYRAQAIARAQQELREMVEEMPETSYELTLKDIVEQRRELRQSMEEGEESQGWWLKKNGSVRRQESNKTRRVIVNNGSMNNNKGLLINLFYPSLIGSKKKSVVKSSSKSDIRDQSSGGDRWDKKFTGSGDNRESIGITSSSSGRTGRSGSSGSSDSSANSDNSTRRESDCSHGCSSFFSSKKKKKKK